MIFEVILARGTKLWIDGKYPNITEAEEGWSAGEIELADGGSCGESTRRNNGDLLPFDAFNLDTWAADTNVTEYCAGENEAKTITLTTDKGIFVLPVTVVRIADEDAEYDEETETQPANIVKLANGEDFELDEIMLYIRAEG